MAVRIAEKVFKVKVKGQGHSGTDMHFNFGVAVTLT